jgi:hypothetical protein
MFVAITPYSVHARTKWFFFERVTTVTRIIIITCFYSINTVSYFLGRDPHVSNFDRTRCLAGCEEILYLRPGRLR